jgi:phosphoglycerate kinase
LSLRQHREFLSNSLGFDVSFIEGFFGQEVESEVEGLESGGVALLENIRFLSEELKVLPPEKHAESIFVQRLSSYFDLFVFDGFSVAHRSHGSVVGFAEVMDSVAGPVMKHELENCSKVRDEFDNGVLVLGGEKPADIIDILHELVESVDKVLLGGVPGELALIAEGFNLGSKQEWIREKGFDEREEEFLNLIENHREKFELPVDVGTPAGNRKITGLEDENPWDIGRETTRKYVEIISSANQILMKGPMGKFEQHSEGTKKLVDAIAENPGFTVLGGGHTSSLVKRFDHDLDDFSHVSIAGGAFVHFMSGEKLPAVKALER